MFSYEHIHNLKNDVGKPTHRTQAQYAMDLFVSWGDDLLACFGHLASMVTKLRLALAAHVHVVGVGGGLASLDAMPSAAPVPVVGAGGG